MEKYTQISARRQKTAKKTYERTSAVGDSTKGGIGLTHVCAKANIMDHWWCDKPDDEVVAPVTHGALRASFRSDG